MFRSSLPILLFLLLGSASAGVLFVKNPDGTFTEKVDQGYGSSSETVLSDRNSNNYEGNAKSSFDDADLELIHEYFPDQDINQTGKLRYSDLPLVEKSLKKDIFMLIAKNEDYMAFLNYPSHKDLFVMINDMIQGPNQAVLQEQVFKKVLAIEAYYKKFVEPLDRQDTIEKAMKLLMRLNGGSVHGNLTVEDTIELDQNLETIAFLLNQNLTQRLVTMLEDDLHPVSSEHKRSHHVRKSAIPKSSTEVPSSNQAEGFANVPPSSLSRKENVTDIDPTIYTGPRRPMPFTNNNGTKVEVSKAKPSEDQAVKNASKVNIAPKLSDDVLDRPRNFPFNDELEKFVSGNSEDDNATLAVHPAVGFSLPIKPSKDQAVKNFPNVTNVFKLFDDVLDRPRYFPFNDELEKFVSGNSEDDNATSAVHPAVGFSLPIKPSEDQAEKNASSVTNNLKSSDDVLDRPRNFPFNDEIQKFVSGNSEDDRVPSTGNPLRSSVQTTTPKSFTLTETRMTEGKHSEQGTTNSSKTHMPKTTTMAPVTKGMSGTHFP